MSFSRCSFGVHASINSMLSLSFVTGDVVRVAIIGQAPREFGESFAAYSLRYRPSSYRKSMVASQGHGLRARPDAKLVEDVRSMIAYRLFANVHLRRDFIIAQPSGYEC
jgi:hypothetical protein